MFALTAVKTSVNLIEIDLTLTVSAAVILISISKIMSSFFAILSTVSWLLKMARLDPPTTLAW